MSTFRSEQLKQPISLSGSFTGSLLGTSSYADRATTSSYADKAGNAVTYINDNLALTGIQIEDYDTNVTVTFTNGTLKFTFGAPTTPVITDFSLNGFEPNRFDKVNDTYDINGTFSVGGYTLISASIYTGSTVIKSVGSGTTINTTLTTSGSQTYWFYVTASNPSDNTLTYVSKSVVGPLVKTPPVAPTQTETPTIQLGVYSGNKIEQGATGSILITSTVGSANDWTITSFRATGSLGPTPTKVPLFGNTDGSQGTGTLIVTGSATGSNSVSISTTASYQSGTTLNSSNITTNVYDSITYTKVRSLRYGASALNFDANSKSDLENLALWDTTLGGSIGTITSVSGSTTNYAFSITWTGQYYHYIIIDSTLSLTSLSIGGLTYPNISDAFTTITTTGGTPAYKIYRSNNTLYGNNETANYIITIA
jgi:hypothetical protein